jgi:hypothetical protein
MHTYKQRSSVRTSKLFQVIEKLFTHLLFRMSFFYASLLVSNLGKMRDRRCARKTLSSSHWSCDTPRVCTWRSVVTSVHTHSSYNRGSLQFQPTHKSRKGELSLTEMLWRGNTRHRWREWNCGEGEGREFFWSLTVLSDLTLPCVLRAPWARHLFMAGCLFIGLKWKSIYKGHKRCWGQVANIAGLSYVPVYWINLGW